MSSPAVSVSQQPRHPAPPSRGCCRGCSSACPCSCSTALVIAFRLFLLSFLGVSIFLVIFFFKPLSETFLSVMVFLDDQPIEWVALILLGANVVAALMFLPCLPFTMAAGYLLRPVRGTIVVALASTIAAVLGFLIGRYLARSLVEKSLGGKQSKWRVLDNAISGDGFRIVFLVRLSPIHPYAIMNYLFGLTSVSLREYTFASFFAMLPTTAMEVYSGAQLKKLDEVLRGDASAPSGVLLAVGLVVTIVVTVVLTVWVRRTLKKELDRYAPVSEEEEEEEDVTVLQLEGIDVSSDSEVDDTTAPSTVDGSTLLHSYALERVHAAAAFEAAKHMEDDEKQGPTVDALASGDTSELELSAVVSPTRISASASSITSPSSSLPSTASSSVVVSPVQLQRRVISRQSLPDSGPVQHSSPLGSPVRQPLSSPSHFGQSSSVLLSRSVSSSSLDGDTRSSSGSTSGEPTEGEKLIKHR